MRWTELAARSLQWVEDFIFAQHPRLVRCGKPGTNTAAITALNPLRGQVILVYSRERNGATGAKSELSFLVLNRVNASPGIPA